MRKCCLCHAEDRAQFRTYPCTCPGGPVLGHMYDCPAIEHFVQKRSMPFTGKLVMVDAKQEDGTVKRQLGLPRELTKRGWELRGQFQGRQAIQRTICQNCHNNYKLSMEIKAFKDKIAKEFEQEQGEMSMYEVLCS